MSTIDEIIRNKYLSGRLEAYNNDDNIFFINILNSLISHSPNNIRHIDNILKIKNDIYYSGLYKELYEDKNLDLYFGTNRTLKSKEMIILELYFI
tara:strand:- start:962 stop:1246 length:285 start_codon:yes stop_codon:yes gene_type:complete